MLRLFLRCPIRIRPLTSQRVHSLHKMPKVYMWESSLVPTPGARFENLIALHLAKLGHFLHDYEGLDAEIHYLRDRAGHEVDFVITIDRRPWFAVETKLSAATIDPSLAYFRDRLRIPWTYQVVLEGSRDFAQNGIRCVPARQFLGALV